MNTSDFKLNLVISCKVTHDRPVNLCNRFDMFLGTLESYSRIPWNNVYLFVDLDNEFADRLHEILDVVQAKFSCECFVFNDFRILDQVAWQEFFLNKLSDDSLFWFTQNDDHPYIDDDIGYLLSGCNLVRQAGQIPCSLYLSHWPEILKLSGKLETPHAVSNYIVFSGFLIDSIQIFNSELIRQVFFQCDWGGKQYKRIDTLMRNVSFWGEDKGNVSRNDQLIYVPLKEICRKFAAYSHVYMDKVPPLKLSFRLESEAKTHGSLREMMTASHSSFWTAGNSFDVPESWIKRSIELYGLTIFEAKHPMIETSEINVSVGSGEQSSNNSGVTVKAPNAPSLIGRVKGFFTGSNS